MTRGLGDCMRAFGVMYDHTHFFSCKSQEPQVKWPVNLVIVDGHFNLHRRFVWVCMG